MGDFETTTAGVLGNAGLTPPTADPDNIDRHAMESATLNRGLFGRRDVATSNESGAFSLDLADSPGTFSVTLTADATFAGFSNWASGEDHAAVVLVDLNGFTLTLPTSGWTWHTLDGAPPSAGTLTGDDWSFLAVSTNAGAAVDAHPLTGIIDSVDTGEYGYLVDYVAGTDAGDAPTSDIMKFRVTQGDGRMWHWNGSGWLQVTAYPSHFGNLPIQATSSAALQLVEASTRAAYTVTLEADSTLSFAGWKAADEHWASITFLQDGTGGWTLDLSAIDEWPDGAGSTVTTPVMPTAAVAEMQIHVMSRDSGTTVYGWRIR